jgi:simple sugar transport system permease protein
MNSTVEEVAPEKTATYEYKEKFSLKKFLRQYAVQLGILGVFFAIWAFFIISAPDTFLQPRIYLAFMGTIPLFALMALPLTLVVISGEIDLSFTSIMAIGMIAFMFVHDVSGNVWLSFIAALAVGLFAGLVNGAIVVIFGIPSLVATIGTQFFWRGAVLVLGQGSSGSLVYTKESLLHPFLVKKVFGSIPMQFIWLIIVAIIMWVILNRTRMGAHIYLTGDNEESARLMGVNTKRVRYFVFGLTGLVSAFAGVVASLHVTYFWPSLGEGYLLRTLSSVFLGGTSVFGGTGTILGTFIGAFIVGSIEAGIVAIGWTNFLTQLIYGLIIVVSVALQAILSRRMQ